MIYGKDHAIGKNAEAPADAIEKIERTRVCKEAEWENLNFEGVRDHSMSISHALKKRPTTSNSSSRKRRRTDDSEESKESFKELTYLFVLEMKETSSRLSQALGQEINEKQVGLSWRKLVLLQW